MPSQPRRINGTAGAAIGLNAAELFNISPSGTFRWEQVFPDKDTRVYISSHRATLENAASSIATVRATNPGNYRFRLTIEGATPQRYEVDVWSTKDLGRKLTIEGIEFPDVFDRLGGPEFDIRPEEARCFPGVMSHVLQGPMRVGANLVAVAPAVFYKQVTPTPQFAPWENDVSLNDDAFYAALIGAMKARGFKVMHTEQPSDGFYGTPEDWAMIPKLMNESPSWWAAWFNEWEKWIVGRAARAQASGVDILVLMQGTDRTFRPQVYPDYARRWREIIAKARTVYKGEIAVTLSNHADANFTFADAVDVVIVGSFSGWQLNMEVNGQRLIRDRKDPKLEELIEAYRRTFAQSRALLAGKARVYYEFGAVSADGQEGSEDPDVIVTLTPDFREQALYYEALFTALADEPWVTGLILQRMDWFDQYRRPRDQIYWDETLASSPRSKPAEEIMRLWYGMF